MSFYTNNYCSSSIPISAFSPVEWVYPRTLIPTDGGATALNIPLTTYRYIHEYYNKKSGLEKIAVKNTLHKKINLKYPDFSKLESINISTSSLRVSGTPPFVGVSNIDLKDNQNLTDFNFSGALSLVNSSNLNLGAILSANGWYYSPYVYSGPVITLSGNPQLTSFTQDTIITDVNKIFPSFTLETGERVDNYPYIITYNILDPSTKNINITLRDDTNSLAISSNTSGLNIYDIMYAHLDTNTAYLTSMFSIQNTLFVDVNFSSTTQANFNIQNLNLNLDLENVNFYSLNIPVVENIPSVEDIFNLTTATPGKSWFITKKSAFTNVMLSSYTMVNLSGLDINVNPNSKITTNSEGQFYINIGDNYAPDMRPMFCNLQPKIFELMLFGSSVFDRYRYQQISIPAGVYTGRPISLSGAMLHFYNSVSGSWDVLWDQWLLYLIAYTNTDNEFVPGSLLEEQYKMTTEPITGRGYPESLPYSHFQILSTSLTQSLTTAPTGPGSFGATNVNFSMNKNSVYQWPVSCLNNVSRDIGTGKVVLIHPQYGLVARHYLPGGGTNPIGRTINFKNLNNESETHNRTITNYVTSGVVPTLSGFVISDMSDLGVVKLNTPLPLSAFPGFHILPKSLWQNNFNTKIPNFFSEFFLSQDMDVTPRSGFITRYPKFEGANKDAYGMHFSSPNFNNEILATQSKIVRVGDSSHPFFMFINNRPVLNGLAYYTAGEFIASPSITYHYPHIQAIVDNLEGQPVQLNLITQADVDVYNNYLPL